MTALTSLLLLNYIAKQFGQLVGKGLPWSVIGEFFVLSLPLTVAMTLPMAVLIATLYAFSRLAAENELTAMNANGVSTLRLLIPVVMAAGILSLIMVAFNDQVLSAANHRLRTLQGDIARKKPTFALREQVLNEVSPGQLYIRANHLDEYSNRMREVTIYDLADNMRRRTVYADSGMMAFDQGGSDLILTLYDGQMIEVPKNAPLQLQRLYYHIDHVRVRGVANAFEPTTEDTFKSDREMSVCELQQEVARNEMHFDRARTELLRALRAQADARKQGRVVYAPQPVENPNRAVMSYRSDRVSLGQAYCDLLARVFRYRPTSMALVTKAYAAQPPRASGWALALQQSTQDSARRAQQQDSIRRARQQDSIRRAQQDSVRRAQLQEAAKRAASQDPLQRQIDSVRAQADSLLRAATGAPPSTVQQGPKTQAIGTTGDSLVLPANVTPVMPPTITDTSVSAPVAPSAGVISGNEHLQHTEQSLQPVIDAARNRVNQAQVQANQYAVEIHKKFALSLACVVFVLLGAPIAVRFPRGGVGLVIGASLVVFALYYIGLIAGEALADRDILSPFFAMWSANILFTVVGVLLLLRMSREGATARGGDMSEIVDSLRNLGRFFRFGRSRRRGEA
jgi:lipopolysaccharide export system permease protein